MVRAIPFGKEALKNMVFSLRQYNFFVVCSADSGSFPDEVKFYFICARDFHQGGLTT